MITVKDLTYKYDSRFCALFNVNLQFIDNKNYLIFSMQELESQTLFRILSKQYKDYSGEIFIDNANLKSIPLNKLNIAYITKEPFLINNKSVLYNIAYPQIIRGEDKTKSLENAKSILINFGFENLINKKTKDLSKEEKITITILRATIRKPKYILIDDIFSDDERRINLIYKLSKNSQLIFAINDINKRDRFKDFELISLSSIE